MFKLSQTGSPQASDSLETLGPGVYNSTPTGMHDLRRGRDVAMNFSQTHERHCRG